MYFVTPGFFHLCIYQYNPRQNQLELYYFFFGGLFQIMRANLARRHISSLFFSPYQIQHYFKLQLLKTLMNQ